MRIRSTKPEFWERAISIPHEVIWDGPRPTRVNAVAPMRAGVEYVYMLFDPSDQLLYVGRSFRPADRFASHCRRVWWPDVERFAFVAVSDPIRIGEYRKYRTPPNVAAFETLAIQVLDPIHNIVRPRKVVA